MRLISAKMQGRVRFRLAAPPELLQPTSPQGRSALGGKEDGGARQQAWHCSAGGTHQRRRWPAADVHGGSVDGRRSGRRGGGARARRSTPASVSGAQAVAPTGVVAWRRQHHGAPTVPPEAGGGGSREEAARVSYRTPSLHLLIGPSQTAVGRPQPGRAGPRQAESGRTTPSRSGLSSLNSSAISQ